MSSCTAQELVWVGTTISELDGDGEKSRIFFIHGSGDSGSEELHTPARNINTEMNDFNKTCDGHLVARKNPHSTDAITSHWEGVGNSLRVYRTAELVSHCLYSNQSSPIYTAGEAKLLLLYLSTAGINSNLQSLMRKLAADGRLPRPRNACGATDGRSIHYSVYNSRCPQAAKSGSVLLNSC